MTKTIYFMVNIYSKCSPRENRAMWSDILLRKANLSGEVWCVLGDFNYVCSLSEII